MNLEEYLLEVITGQRESIKDKIVLILLTGLAWIYQGIIWMRSKVYDWGLKESTDLSAPVISVGNITVGGTGKTPVVKMLASKLLESDHQSVILNRGYKGELEEDIGIVSDGQEVLLSAQEAGDEAYMLANNLPSTPIVIGKDRSRTGEFTLQEFGPDFIILDDAFQHWQVERDYDLVVVDATNPFANGYLLPRGRLREPVSSLQRANCLLLTKADQVTPKRLESIKDKLREINTTAMIITTRHKPTYLRKIGNQEHKELDLEDQKVLAVSGIGNPQAFEQTLKDLGAQVVDEFRFSDHHTYTKEEVMEIFTTASEQDVDRIITTEKDAVSIDQELIAEINRQQINLEILGIEIEILDSEEKSDEFFTQLEGLQQ
ncbi:tetraacyldisaccharide 4'-kinase [Halanaerocella petrolearia]